MEAAKYGLIGNSSAMGEVFSSIERIVKKDYGVPIFIHGKSGTGKESVARAIHKHSSRKGNKFFVVDFSCRYSEGSYDVDRFLESAQGGTLFLDKIGSMPLEIQSGLVRALENGYTPIGSNDVKKVDVQLIATSDEQLYEMINQGRLCDRLYYTMKSAKISVPPLKDREGDVELLAEYFLSQHEQELVLHPEALELLNAYFWPGNVRELRSVIELSRVLADGNAIQSENIQFEDRYESYGRDYPCIDDRKKGEDVRSYAKRIERGEILRTLRRYRTLEAAARDLGIKNSGVDAMLRKHEIPKEEARNLLKKEED